MRVIDIISESSRGALFRTTGDPFVSISDPNDVLKFVQAQYFPDAAPNSKFEDAEEALANVEQVEQSYPNLVWTNKANKNSLAFAIITLNDSNNQPKHYGRFFSHIAADMAGKWANDGIPGYKLNTKTSQKANSGLKPADIFAPGQVFKNISEIINTASAKLDPVLIGGLGMIPQNQLPSFQGQAERESAIRDDLGETISVMALWQGMIGDQAEDARQFLLKTQPWSTCSITFPAGKNNGLIDSIMRPRKGQAIGISAKGAAGAKASSSNIWSGVLALRASGQGALVDQYPDAVTVLETIQDETLVNAPFVLGTNYGICTHQDWELYNLSVKQGLRAVPKGPEWANFKTLMSHITPKTADAGNYNIGYHALAGLASVVADTVNQSVPKFSEACLVFLNSSPLIQIHTDTKVTPQGVEVTGFRPIWPPQFSGIVRLNAGKAYSCTGGTQKYAFDFKK